MRRGERACVVRRGDAVVDRLTGRLGVVAQVTKHEVKLRSLPAGDGPDWSTPLHALRPAEDREVRSALRRGRGEHQ